ncbi:HNH endonuclease [Candidatus Margulisiibacteriota bacterium]
MANVKVSQNGFSKVLVLNTTFLPINICSWKRAITLVFKGKADGIESSPKKINGKFMLPMVIKLKKYIPLPYNGVIFTRRNVFLRDNFTCQYCGKKTRLTIDHIVPKSRGGEDTWSNVAVSCVRCNNKKGDMSLEDAEMKLQGTPYKPPSGLYLQMTRYNSAPDSWQSYFFRKASSN